MNNGTLRLSEREWAVLEIIAKGERRTARASGTPTGAYIARNMINDYDLDTSPQGAHQTAASLVRKHLAIRAGTSRLQWYYTTPLGREYLRRTRQRHGGA